MKKNPGLLLLISGLLCVKLSFTQSLFYDYNYVPIASMTDSSIKANGIAEIIVDATYISRNGKSDVGRSIHQYDRQGQNTFYCYLNDTLKPGRIYYQRLYNKGTDVGPSSTSMTRGANKRVMTRIPRYNPDGQLAEILVFKANGMLSHAYKLFYKDSLLSRYDYYNSKFKLRSYYQYEYAGKKMKSSALYTSKGKLIRFTDFECDAEGITRKKNSDTTKVCEFKTYMADGSKVITKTYLNNGKTPIKTVTHLDSSDNIKLYCYYEGTEYILRYKDQREYIGRKVVERYTLHANSKGKVSYARYTRMDLNGRIVSEVDTTFQGNKSFKATRYEHAYTDDGLLIKSTGYENGRISLIKSYKYTLYRRE